MPLIKKEFSFEGLLFDTFCIFTFFIFLTGGGGFIHGTVKDLIDQKPIYHRLGILGIYTVNTLWYLLRFQINSRHSCSTILVILRSLFKNTQTILWACLIFFTSLYTFSSWVRHDALRSSFDMAIFTQAIWNTTQGNFLYSSIKGGIILLGDHFSPILVFTAIPYALFPAPKTLLFIQSFAAISGIFPIFKIAEALSGNRKLALTFVFSYLLYLPLRNAIRFDFHPEILAIPLFLWAYYQILKNRFTLASVFLFFALLTKENAALVTFAVGAYGFFISKRKVWGIGWMIFSAAYFWIVIYWIIPALSGQPYFYLDGNFLSWKDAGIFEFLKYMLSPSSLIYLVKIFMPVGFFSFWDIPTLLINFPTIFQNLAARNEATRSIFFQYTAFLIPFVFISAIKGSIGFSQSRFLIPYLFFSTAVMSGVPEGYTIYLYQSQRTANSKQLSNFLKAIPPEYSIRTQEFLAPHAAHRKELHIYENENPKEGASQKALSADMVILDSTLIKGDWQAQLNWLERHNYKLINPNESFFVYRKKSR